MLENIYKIGVLRIKVIEKINRKEFLTVVWGPGFETQQKKFNKKYLKSLDLVCFAH